MSQRLLLLLFLCCGFHLSLVLGNDADDGDEDEFFVQLPDSGKEHSDDSLFHASFHFRLLNDRTRTKKFEEAIRRTVKGKTVLDLGAGTGFLSMLAVRHGATHVWAVERNPMTSKVAREILTANGMEDKVTFIRARSQDVYVDRECAPGTPCIPSKCEVLLSDMLTAEIFGGQWPAVLKDARRLVREDAAVIPLGARLFALPIWSTYSLPAKGKVSGLIMEPMRALKAVSQHVANIHPGTQIPMISKAKRVMSFKFKPGEDILPGGVDVPVTVNGTGLVSTMVLWWSAKLAPAMDGKDAVWLTSGPATKGEEQTHQGQMWFHLVRDVPVTKGSTLRMSVLHDGQRSFAHAYLPGDRRTFLTFANRCEFDVQVYWKRGSDTTEHQAGVLTSGANMVQKTFKADQWILKWNNGVQIIQFEADEGHSHVIVFQNHTAALIQPTRK